MAPTAGRLQRRVHQILEIPSAPGDRLGQAFDTMIVTLIVLNVAAVIAESVPDVQRQYGEWLRAFEWLSLAVFGAEYLLRLWSAPAMPEHQHPVQGRLRWAVSWTGIVDLVAILPALLTGTDLRFVRVLRLLRLLKLGRYSLGLQTLTNVMRSRASALLTSLFIVALALVVMSTLMYYAEHDAQPDKFPHIPAAMWWGIVTLTTTGYGDVVPLTVAGRVLGGLAVLIGVGVIALPVGLIASGFVEEIERQRQAAAKAAAAVAERCPHCGGDLHGAAQEPRPPSPPAS